MRKVEIEVYKVNELGNVAQQRAYHEWERDSEYPWSSENRNTLSKFTDIFPVYITTWEYNTYSHYVGFRFNDENASQYGYEEEIANLSGVRLATYLWNNYKNILFKGKYYSKGKWMDGKYTYKHRHSKVILANDCVLTGYYMDNWILSPIYEFLKKPCENTTFEELLNDCLQSWGKGCSEDMKGYYSMESFIETSEANEWEYDIDGNIFFG